jgi:hypothetical protein
LEKSKASTFAQSSETKNIAKIRYTAIGEVGGPILTGIDRHLCGVNFREASELGGKSLHSLSYYHQKLKGIAEEASLWQSKYEEVGLVDREIGDERLPIV